MKSSDNNLGLPSDPIDGLLAWLKDAEAAKIYEPTAMTLATVGENSRPSARIVLFKGLSPLADRRRAPRFFTNYRSRKSQELERHPLASLVFHWPQLHRQLRIEGRVEKTSYEESNAYFQTRARGSQIGAWASPQSTVINDRSELERLVKETEEKFKDQKVISCPPHWGGWRVIPERIEFWSGVNNRLHDRIVFEFKNSQWIQSRLAP